jgi:hypothetical protein
MVIPLFHKEMKLEQNWNFRVACCLYFAYGRMTKGNFSVAEEDTESNGDLPINQKLQLLCFV